jgi:hypothetical protein
MTGDEVAVLCELLAQRLADEIPYWYSVEDLYALEAERLTERGLLDATWCRRCENRHYRASDLAEQEWHSFADRAQWN